MWNSGVDYQQEKGWYRPKPASGGGTTTFNPADTAGTVTLSGGNLVQTGTGAGSSRTIASHSTGKFFFEYVVGTGNAYEHAIGLANSTASLTVGPGSPDTNSLAYYEGDPLVYCAGGSIGSSGLTYVAGDTIDMAVDIGAGLVWVRQNGGNWNNSGSANPATGTGGLSFTLTGPLFALGYVGASGRVNTFNFGGSAYAYAAPSGFGNF